MAQRSLRGLWVLMATVFLDMVGFAMVLTQLPYLALRLGLSETLLGPLLSAFALAQLVTAPRWGRFSDRHGRRPPILMGLFASAVAFAVFGLASTEGARRLLGAGGAVAILLLSRIAQGAGGGTIGVVQAYVADITAPGERSEKLGWLTSATSAGVLIGPALGSAAFHLGPAAPGFLAAGLCLANIAFAWRWLPEADGGGRKRPGAGPAAPAVRGALTRSVLAVVRNPREPRNSLIWIYALGMLAFMSLNGVLVLYLNAAFGIDEANIGWFYAYVAAITLVMRAVLLGPIVRRLGEPATMRCGVLLVGLGLFAIPLAWNILTLGLVALFMPVGTALLFPVTTSMVSQRSRAGEGGATMGVQQAFGGSARLLGPLWSTAAFDHLGTAVPFWVAGSLMMVVLVFALRVKPGPVEHAEEEAVGEESTPVTEVPGPLLGTEVNGEDSLLQVEDTRLRVDAVRAADEP